VVSVEPVGLPVHLSAVRAVQRLVAQLTAVRELGPTLQAVVDGVVSTLGFDAAVVNVVRADGDLEVAAVAGDDGLRAALEGQVGRRAEWERELARARPWGNLCFASHEDQYSADLPTWVPDIAPSDDPQAWHPMDALFATLWAPTGDLVGVLSVDLPSDGLLPGDLQREMLEMYAAQAAITIDNARLQAATARALSQVEAEKENLQIAFDNAPAGMAMSSLLPGDYGMVVRVNEAMCELLGRPAGVLLGSTLAAYAHPDDVPDVELTGDQLPASARSELRYVHADGHVCWVAQSSTVVRFADGNYLLTQLLDVSARKSRELVLAHDADHDPLTGLPNRRRLQRRLRDVTAAPEAGQVAVLFCDLDEFKSVNDEHGHDAGDAVLITTGRRLQAEVRERDTVARLGGDEFVVVVQGMSEGGLTELCARLVATVAQPIQHNGQLLEVSISVGLACTGGDCRTVEALLRRADEAMFRVKEGRRRR
jgi:diguanylate cyclase (GGDEF)-like protein/PAS domain S-box-containing protein